MFTKIGNYLSLLPFLILIGVVALYLIDPKGGAPQRDQQGSIRENAPISLEYPLGTNIYGQDVLSRDGEAICINLLYSLVALLSFLFFGILMGIGLGFKSTSTTGSLSWMLSVLPRRTLLKKALLEGLDLFVQTLQLIPLIIFILITVLFVQIVVLDPTLRFFVDMGFLGLFMAPKLATALSDRIKVLRNEEYIQAAKGMNISRTRLIVKHILLMECRGILILQSINLMIQAIMIEILLSYFRYGPTQNTLGNLFTADVVYMAGLFASPNLNFNLEFWQSITTFILIILMSLTFRWIGKVAAELVD